MARNYILTQKARTGITTADTVISAAPEDSTGTSVSPPPTGSIETKGATMLRIDVAAPATATGNYIFNIYGWNSKLNAWVSEGQATVAAAATGDFGGRLFGSAVITNWCRDYALVLIQTMATNGGVGVGTSVSVSSCVQDR